MTLKFVMGKYYETTLKIKIFLIISWELRHLENNHFVPVNCLFLSIFDFGHCKMCPQNKFEISRLIRPNEFVLSNNERIMKFSHFSASEH